MPTSYVINDPLAVIYNESQWRLNKVSPMNNLLRNELKLKQYSTKIKQTLVSAVAANASMKFSIVITDLPHLKYTEEDPNGLMITVSTSQDSNKTKVAYEAIFLSWGINTIIDGATHLPYMLDRGEQRIATAVKSSVQTIFDCNIKQFCFTQLQLLQFGFNFVDNDTSKGTDPFTLSFKTPQVDFKSKLSLSFEVGDVHTIWNGIKDEVNKDSERAQLAYQILQNQIYHMAMLDVTVLDLCEIKLPKAEIKNTGAVKMKTPEIVNCVLTVLNEISSIHEMINISDLSVKS
ncbi:centromere protein L-like [Epargyreus clarus]|uniref:centromere protein L-like n=1 Tax=Epargyreus clarus TaxID=520877 RepID=UPI003C2E51DA